MNIICLQSNEENMIIENEENNFNEQYACQEIFYPLWFLEVEVCMQFFSKIKKTSMKVAVDGLSGDVSFIGNEIKTSRVDVKPEQVLPIIEKMDIESSEKVKESLMPFVLTKARSLFVRPTINIRDYSIVYKHLYRLSSKDEDGEIIFLDNSTGKIALLKKVEVKQ